MKVVMLSLQDHTGSGYKIAEAVNMNSNIFVEYIVLLDDLSGHNAYKYPYLYRKRDTVDNGWNVPKRILQQIQLIVNEADIIHFKGDEMPKDGNFYGIMIPEDKPKVITVAGSLFRRGNSSVAFQKRELDDYIQYFDLITALTPDLNYPELNGKYIPHASKYVEYKWKKKEIPIINHTFVEMEKKGFSIFQEAIDILKKRNLKFEVNITENVTNIESLKHRANATIYHDQISDVGWHGMSAIESMSYGVPTTAYLSEEAIKFGNVSNTAVVNCGKTPIQLANTFERLLKSDLTELSKETFDYAKNTYSYDSVGKVWSNIYASL